MSSSKYPEAKEFIDSTIAMHPKMQADGIRQIINATITWCDSGVQTIPRKLPKIQDQAGVLRERIEGLLATHIFIHQWDAYSKADIVRDIEALIESQKKQAYNSALDDIKAKLEAL